jgi:glyoxylase-like metal-dependent hydrolase (beta-lactamase superfamily II)
MKKKSYWFIIAACGLVFPARAQSTINPLVQKAVLAMGTNGLHTIRYSGSGTSGVFGQNHSPHGEWPVLIIKSYTRTIDYATQSSTEDVVRMYENPPSKGGGAPFINEQKQTNTVAGLPSSMNALEDRHLQLLVTPHGFLKQTLTNGTTTVRKVKGGGSEISFSVGKFRIVGMINKQGLVEKVNTWIANPVLGDMLMETVYSDYKDYRGIKFPNQIIQNTGGHMVLNLTLSGVEMNVSNMPSFAPAATLPPVVTVESKKLSEGIWIMAGGSHNSLLVEFNDYVTVLDAPLNEARSLAVIAEVKKLVPNKPIQYVVNSHHHFDHSGGLRTYVAEGATVITSDINPAFYEEVWKTPRTLAPDNLSQNPRKATFIGVNDKYVLTDGTHTLELYHNLGSYHNAGMLFGYLPKDKILFVVDEYSPGRLVNGAMVPVAKGFASNLDNNLQHLNLDVVTIAPGHGAVVPFSDMLRDIGK